jgi:hypothetical protein
MQLTAGLKYRPKDDQPFLLRIVVPNRTSIDIQTLAWRP